MFQGCLALLTFGAEVVLKFGNHLVVFFATFDSRLGMLERCMSPRSARPPAEVREADREYQTRALLEKQNGEPPENRPVRETGLPLAGLFSLRSWEPYRCQGTVR